MRNSSRGGMQTSAANYSIICPKCGKLAARKEPTASGAHYLHFTKNGSVLHAFERSVPQELGINKSYFGASQSCFFAAIIARLSPTALKKLAKRLPSSADRPSEIAIAIDDASKTRSLPSEHCGTFITSAHDMRRVRRLPKGLERRRRRMKDKDVPYSETSYWIAACCEK